MPLEKVGFELKQHTFFILKGAFYFYMQIIILTTK